MRSIQLVQFQDVVKLNDIFPIEGADKRSIGLVGEDFSSVDKVLLNGIAADEFYVFSNTELAVVVPDVIVEEPIHEVVVLSNKPTLTERSLVSLTFGTSPKSASGPMRLMQNFIRLLLRSTGSNLFHRESGGGLISLIGSTVSNKIAADVQIAVDKTKQYMIRAQSMRREIPPSERLLEAELAAVQADKNSTSVTITIVLTNHARQRLGATLVS